MQMRKQGRSRGYLPNGCMEVHSIIVSGSGVFRGALCEGRTAVIFVTILGLFLAPFRDKIAATSDQMRFFGRKML